MRIPFILLITLLFNSSAYACLDLATECSYCEDVRTIDMFYVLDDNYSETAPSLSSLRSMCHKEECTQVTEADSTGVNAESQ